MFITVIGNLLIHAILDDNDLLSRSQVLFIYFNKEKENKNSKLCSFDSCLLWFKRLYHINMICMGCIKGITNSVLFATVVHFKEDV